MKNKSKDCVCLESGCFLFLKEMAEEIKAMRGLSSETRKFAMDYLFTRWAVPKEGLSFEEKIEILFNPNPHPHSVVPAPEMAMEMETEISNYWKNANPDASWEEKLIHVNSNLCSIMESSVLFTGRFRESVRELCADGISNRLKLVLGNPKKYSFEMAQKEWSLPEEERDEFLYALFVQLAVFYGRWGATAFQYDMENLLLAMLKNKHVSPYSPKELYCTNQALSSLVEAEISAEDPGDLDDLRARIDNEKDVFMKIKMALAAFKSVKKAPEQQGWKDLLEWSIRHDRCLNMVIGSLVLWKKQGALYETVALDGLIGAIGTRRQLPSKEEFCDRVLGLH